MDKRADRKSNRLTGHKNSRLGQLIGIHDKTGVELKTGDVIFYNDVECIILWNVVSACYEAFLLRSCWYADKDKYNVASYGKCYSLPMDDGARMEIERIEEYC